MRTQVPLTRVQCDDPECVNSIEAPYYDNQHRDITAFISERGWLVIELQLGEKDFCPVHAHIPAFVEDEELIAV